jgi:hypothetical protein
VAAVVGTGGGRAGRWRRIFDIDDRDTLVATRGFHRGREVMVDRLERVGASFVAGYRAALYSGPEGADVAILDAAAPELRGFVAEGAAMGSAVADFASIGGQRLGHWLSRTDARFSYLTHVGVGWAMARLPFSRDRLFRRLDPVHAWLAIDGLGFHDTYFTAPRVLAGWQRERQGYGRRAWHQGVGRALWFVSCGEVARAAGLIERHFAPALHGDLWAGLGLAIAYAGGPGPEELAEARVLAGPLAGDLGQGAVFGAAAHVRHGFVPDHADLAVRMLAGLSAAGAAALADTARARVTADVEGPERGVSTRGVPAYEAWRMAIRAGLGARAPQPEPVA